MDKINILFHIYLKKLTKLCGILIVISKIERSPIMITTKKFHLVGGRIVKTGIAVFLTALICHLFNWSAMFAVIAAIVTIEPTTSDSIKKAFIRFPATAIGAAYAVLFTFLFKDSAFSYAAVALATFVTCNKLKLHAGTLVATITGAAMIYTVQDHYFVSFYERLASTGIGLIVSALVNLLVMPPNYSTSIKHGMQDLYKKAGDLLERRGTALLHHQVSDKELQKEFRQLVKDIDRVANLYLYQKAEWKYHRVSRTPIRKLHQEYKKLMILRGVVHHIGNLIYLDTPYLLLEQNRMQRLISSIKSIKTSFHHTNVVDLEETYKNRSELADWFYETKTNHLQGRSLDAPVISPETTVLYEILAIYDLTFKLHHIRNKQQVALQEKEGA